MGWKTMSSGAVCLSGVRACSSSSLLTTNWFLGLRKALKKLTAAAPAVVYVKHNATTLFVCAWSHSQIKIVHGYTGTGSSTRVLLGNNLYRIEMIVVHQHRPPVHAAATTKEVATGRNCHIIIPEVICKYLARASKRTQQNIPVIFTCDNRVCVWLSGDTQRRLTCLLRKKSVAFRPTALKPIICLRKCT